jgi:hypothetical protein
MTILLFLSTDFPFLLLDSDQSPENLSAAINASLWQPPTDFLAWLQGQGYLTTHLRLCASQHDNLVIVTPNSASALPSRSSLVYRIIRN